MNNLNLRLPACDEEAKREKHVFIPLDGTAAIINDLIELPGQTTFIRAPVASGKSTLAYYLSNIHADEYVMVESARTDMLWYANLVRAASTDPDHFEVITDHNHDNIKSQARAAVGKFMKENKTLIIDEGHQLFGCENAYTDLTKNWKSNGEKIKMLLFSAVGSGVDDDGAEIATPSEITKKYMWYPPMPSGEILVPQLRAAEIYLDGDATELMIRICGMHRGIFIRAMEWVQREQQKEETKATASSPWNAEMCLSIVRQSFQISDSCDKEKMGSGWSQGLRLSMAESRAVRVNGKYSNLGFIPKELITILFGGSKFAPQLNDWERILTIAGFIIPEPKNCDDEFVKYDWGGSNTSYGLANPIMAQYYQDSLEDYGYNKLLDVKYPGSGPDLLAKALPFMTFTTVVTYVSANGKQRRPPFSSKFMPYEDHYNGALVKVLEDLGYTPQEPKGNEGKVDVLAGFFMDGMRLTCNCAIETIMASRDQSSHDEHARRFEDLEKKSYSEADLKVLVTIGARASRVKHMVKETASVNNLDVVGLVTSMAHDSYEMYIRFADDESNIIGPIFVVCDRVAKRLQRRGSALAIESAQTFRKKRKDRTD